jgi:hypothetical protein
MCGVVLLVESSVETHEAELLVLRRLLPHHYIISNTEAPSKDGKYTGSKRSIIIVMAICVLASNTAHRVLWLPPSARET